MISILLNLHRLSIQSILVNIPCELEKNVYSLAVGWSVLLDVCRSMQFLKKYFYLFIYGCVGSSLLCSGFLFLRRARATLRCGAWASHCGGFSCCRAQALGARASVVVACGLSSCGAQAQLLRGMWDLPGPGLEPMSPALAGGFLTTVPPGKPPVQF